MNWLEHTMTKEGLHLLHKIQIQVQVHNPTWEKRVKDKKMYEESIKWRNKLQDIFNRKDKKSDCRKLTNKCRYNTLSLIFNVEKDIFPNLKCQHTKIENL